MNLKSLSLVGYFILLLALVALVWDSSILAADYIFIIIQILAVMLMLWARIIFGRRSFHASANPTEGGLVTTGPYKYIRHPIYAAVLYFLWAAALSHLAAINILFVVIGTIGAFIRMYAEERLLMLRFPEYADYAARTKRVIPFLL